MVYIRQVHSWLMRQASSVVESRKTLKRKRRTDLALDTNPRSTTRPRLAALQTTHQISDLQQVRLKPDTRRTSIQQACHEYDLDLAELMQQIDRCPQLTNLLTLVDEHTEIDIWHALRTRLHSVAYKSGTRMQRIRSKSASPNCPAKHDPVFFINAEGKTARSANLYGE